MNAIQIQLHDHHQQYQHLKQIRVDLHYTEFAKSSNQSQLAIQDVSKLLERLQHRKYIDSYLWKLKFTHEEGLHAQVLLYLNQEQCNALAIIATEEYWSHLTQQEGFIEERDIEQNVIQYLASETTQPLFKASPERFMGIGQ